MDKFEKLPLRESMRRSHHKEGYDMKMYDQGRQNYKIVSRYIDRCLKKSVGKNFDKVKKHILERMCYNSVDRYGHNLVENLIGGYIGEDDKYMIDSQGRIQINEEYAKRRKGWRDRRVSKKLTLIDGNKDKVYGLRADMTDSEIDILKTKLIINGSYNKSLFNHIVNGGTLSYVKYSDFIHSIKPDNVYKDKWGYWNHDYSLRDYVEGCFIVTEDNIMYVFKDGTAEYRQFKKEQQDQKRKTKRKREKELDEYYNNILQDLENTKKEKERQKDTIDRDRLGFDDESFKGEPYHGQKRKRETN